jgi:NAD(P)-dependent dehydrogenase (short-subunit alcohol dehydrogenase family)
VRAPFLLTQGAVKLMRRDKVPGSIVNILSMNAHCGTPELAVYSASKGAMSTLTRNFANSLLADRIRVNGINLGWADTPAERVLQERISPDGAQWLEVASAARPFGRLINVDEVADLIAFLLSRHSGMMTGTLLDYEQRIVGAP